MTEKEKRVRFPASQGELVVKGLCFGEGTSVGRDKDSSPPRFPLQLPPEESDSQES